MSKEANPTTLAELRQALAEIIDRAIAGGLRSYQIEESLQDAAKVVATRHATTTPSGVASMSVEAVQRFLDRNTR